MQPRLTWNSPCRPGWFQAHKDPTVFASLVLDQRHMPPPASPPLCPTWTAAQGPDQPSALAFLPSSSGQKVAEQLPQSLNSLHNVLLTHYGLWDRVRTNSPACDPKGHFLFLKQYYHSASRTFFFPSPFSSFSFAELCISPDFESRNCFQAQFPFTLSSPQRSRSSLSLC